MTAENPCQLALPDWVPAAVAQAPEAFSDDRAAMDFAIDLARENIARSTGGPFAALVVDGADGRLLAAGVNSVTRTGLSVAHAEIMALSLAQHSLGDWNLARGRVLTLISSCEPCAMCYGALPWSGIRRLVCGAMREDAEAGGFDEGDKPADWADALQRRGIEVTQGVCRERAAGLFEHYRASGGEIYNAT